MFHYAFIVTAAVLTHLWLTLQGLAQQPEYAGHEAVLRAMTEKAESGSPDAQNALGTVYLTGAVIAPDAAVAVKWFKAAVAQGHPAAQANLGSMYLGGWQVEQDQIEGIRLLRLSADQGLPLGIGKLAEATMQGSGVKRNPAEGVRLLKLAAEKRDGYSTFRLARIMGDDDSNWPDIPYDPVEAIKWFRLAAETGYPPAQYEYGRMMLPGHPRQVPGSFEEHFKWLALAANGGDRDAQFDLAVYHRNGKGVSADEAEADKWFKRAAASGHMEAQRVLQEKGGWTPDSTVATTAVLIGLGIAVLAAAEADSADVSTATPENECPPGMVRHFFNGQCYVALDPRLLEALPTNPGY